MKGNKHIFFVTFLFLLFLMSLSTPYQWLVGAGSDDQPVLVLVFAGILSWKIFFLKTPEEFPGTPEKQAKPRS